MQIEKKDLPKSQRELSVSLSLEEFSPYIIKGAQKVSESVKIEGFRPGKVPLEILKQKIGEMSILEAAADIAIRKTVDEVIRDNTSDRQAIGQPQVDLTKLAPENPLEYKIVVSLIPTLELGKYKDLGLQAEEVAVSDEELDKALLQFREMRAQEILTDRAVAAGDKVVCDIQLSVDKVPIENGSHQNLSVILGKQYFVPGFDDKLIGAKKGERKEFSLPYPSDHHQQNLAGKNVDFAVTIKDVYGREIPALDDAFAVQLGLKSLSELKDNFKNNLLQEKRYKAEQKNEIQMLEKIIETSKFGDLPEILIDSESKNMMSELEQNIVSQGGKFDDYLQHIKKDRGALLLDFVPTAIKRAKSALLIREIAKQENISASVDEVAAKKAELKQQHSQNPDVLKMLDTEGYDSYLHNALTNNKVVAKLKEWNYASTGTK